MHSLIIDTATKNLYVCLLKDDEVLFERYSTGFNDHSKNIMMIIQEAVTSNNITIADLDNVIVGYGPGSYTGVRIGVTVAKMFTSFDLDIKLFTISTLFLMSSHYSGNVVSYIDARRGNGYMAYYVNYEEVIEEKKYVKDHFLQRISDAYLIVDEDNMKVCPKTVLKYAKINSNPDSLKPNYLQEAQVDKENNED